MIGEKEPSTETREFTEALDEIGSGTVMEIVLEADSRVDEDVKAALETLMNAGFGIERYSQVFSGASVDGPSKQYQQTIRRLEDSGLVETVSGEDGRLEMTLTDEAYEELPWL